MFVPMIFTAGTLVLKCRATLLNPSGPLSAIQINQPLNIPNALPLRDNTGLGDRIFREFDYSDAPSAFFTLT